MKSQSGQVGVLVLLISAVMLTIGITTVSRSVQEAALSQQKEDTARVFSAAETGVEQALTVPLDFQGEQMTLTATPIPGANATIDVSIRKNRALETRLPQGMTGEVQLQDASGNPTVTSLNIDWSKTANCNESGTATLLLTIYSRSAPGGQINRVRHLATAACDRGDGVPVAGAGSAPYTRSYTVPVLINDVFMRIKPAYQDTQLRVSGSGGTLPVQGVDVRSEAQSTLGQETRIVQVNRTNPVAPSIFDFTVMSGTTIVK